MEDDPRRISVTLTNEAGRHEFRYTHEQANDLVIEVIEAMRREPSAPSLLEEVSLPRPIQTDGIGVFPDPDQSANALLVLRSGKAVLSFSVSLTTLFRLLADLELRTLPDQNSPRPN